MVYGGGLFKCDGHMVSYSTTLQSGDVILDINTTPVKVVDVEDFQAKVQQQHRMVMNEYATEYAKIVE